MADLGEGDSGKTELSEDGGGTTTVTVISNEIDHEYGLLSDLIIKLSDLLMQVPEAYRDKTSFEFTVENGAYDESSAYAEFKVIYTRPATEREIAARKAVEMARQAQNDARAYMQYKELKARFRWRE